MTKKFIDILKDLQEYGYIKVNIDANSFYGKKAKLPAEYMITLEVYDDKRRTEINNALEKIFPNITEKVIS